MRPLDLDTLKQASDFILNADLRSRSPVKINSPVHVNIPEDKTRRADDHRYMEFDRLQGGNGLSLFRLTKILESIKYKPGYQFNMTGWPENPGIRLMMPVQDAYPPYHNTTVTFDFSQIPAFYDENSFIVWVRERIRDMECHEMDEWLLVNDERMFDPHDDTKRRHFR